MGLLSPTFLLAEENHQDQVSLSSASDIDQQLKLNIDLSKDYFENNHYHKADSCIKRGGKLIPFSTNDSLQCNYYHLLWNIEFPHNNVSYSKAMEYLQPAMDFCRSCNDSIQLSSILFKTSNYYFLYKKYDQSYIYATELTQIATLRNDTLHLALSFLLHGDLNNEIYNYKRALNFYDRAIAKLSLLNNSAFILQVHLKKAEIYTLLGNHEKGIVESQKGIEVYKTMVNENEGKHDQKYARFYYFLKSRLMYDYSNTNQLKKASILCDELKTAHQTNNDSWLKGYINNDLAIYYFISEQLDSAKTYFKKELSSLNTNQINHSLRRANTLAYLGQIALYQNEAELAADLLEQSLLVKDSISDARNRFSIQISDWETKYESMEKSSHIEILNETVDQKEHELMSLNDNIILLILFSIVLSFFLIRVLERKRNIIKENKAFKEKIVLLEKKRQAIDKEKKLLEEKMKAKSLNNEESCQKEKYAGTKLNAEESKRVERLLIQEIIDNKAYVNPDLTLDTLANLIDIHRVYLSQIINEQFQMNFNQLINYYRVQEACSMLSSRDYQKYTILYIAQQSGFKSISPFNKAFKTYMIETPSNYRKKMQNKSVH
jgi:AraC-like DNA-binding protein